MLFNIIFGTLSLPIPTLLTWLAVVVTMTLRQLTVKVIRAWYNGALVFQLAHNCPLQGYGAMWRLLHWFLAGSLLHLVQQRDPPPERAIYVTQLIMSLQQSRIQNGTALPPQKTVIIFFWTFENLFHVLHYGINGLFHIYMYVKWVCRHARRSTYKPEHGVLQTKIQATDFPRSRTGLVIVASVTIFRVAGSKSLYLISNIFLSLGVGWCLCVNNSTSSIHESICDCHSKLPILTHGNQSKKLPQYFSFFTNFPTDESMEMMAYPNQPLTKWVSV